jgi:PTS system mannose-specific IID component
VAGLTGRGAALRRLLMVQAAWNYERMQGIGLGHASEPLLRPLRAADPARYRAALARAAAFFNANPYLAPAAVGAEARAEHDGLDGQQVERLRTALCGPLGALGDRLFWTGLVPGLASAALAGVALGLGWWPVLGFVALHNLVRGALGAWLLRLGWEHGVRVGGAITRSRLPWLSLAAGYLAAAAGGLALPLVARRMLDGADAAALAGVGALVAGSLLLRRLAGPRISALPLTLLAGAGVLIWHWGGR